MPGTVRFHETTDPRINRSRHRQTILDRSKRTVHQVLSLLRPVAKPSVVADIQHEIDVLSTFVIQYKPAEDGWHDVFVAYRHTEAHGLILQGRRTKRKGSKLFARL